MRPSKTPKRSIDRKKNIPGINNLSQKVLTPEPILINGGIIYCVYIYMIYIVPMYLSYMGFSLGLFHPQISGIIYISRTQMTHILEDLPHKMEGQPLKKKGQLGSGYSIYRCICIYIYTQYKSMSLPTHNSVEFYRATILSAVVIGRSGF